MSTIAILVALFVQEPTAAERWCVALRAEDIEAREEATGALHSLGRDAVPALRAIVNDADAEVAGRAREILTAIEARLRPQALALEVRLARPEIRRGQMAEVEVVLRNKEPFDVVVGRADAGANATSAAGLFVQLGEDRIPLQVAWELGSERAGAAVDARDFLTVPANGTATVLRGRFMVSEPETGGTLVLKEGAYALEAVFQGGAQDLLAWAGQTAVQEFQNDVQVGEQVQQKQVQVRQQGQQNLINVRNLVNVRQLQQRNNVDWAWNAINVVSAGSFTIDGMSAARRAWHGEVRASATLKVVE